MLCYHIRNHLLPKRAEHPIAGFSAQVAFLQAAVERSPPEVPARREEMWAGTQAVCRTSDQPGPWRHGEGRGAHIVGKFISCQLQSNPEDRFSSGVLLLCGKEMI